MTDDAASRRANLVAAAGARLARLDAARRALGKQHAEDPDPVRRFNAKMARLSAAAKRERERFDTLVLGHDPEPAPLPPRPKGMSKAEWKVEKARRRAEATEKQSLAVKWRGKQGTPETLEAASVTHSDCLDQLERNGTITKEQHLWGQEIALAFHEATADVDIGTVDLNWRIDPSRFHHDQTGENIFRARRAQAFSLWRYRIQRPKEMIYLMLTGDTIGYTVAAKRFRCHNRTALRRLVAALDCWGQCVDEARRAVTQHDLDRIDAMVN